MKYTLFLLTLLCILTGCTQQEATSKETVTAYYKAVAEGNYKEMSRLISAYIQEGLENNMDVRIAIQQMIAAQAYAKQGKAGYLPTVNVGANFTHQVLSENTQFWSVFDQ
nr:TolC family protein [Dokdonia sp. Dokd-P16]